MPLTLNQLEDRRIALEKYLQLLSQDPRTSNGMVFNAFLLAAQQETASEKAEEVDLEVYLMNDSKVTIHGLTILQTAEVLEVNFTYHSYFKKHINIFLIFLLLQKSCTLLGVPDDLVYHFALFLVQRDDQTGEISILRKLQDYESPYISQKAFNNVKLVLRKSSWDPKIDEELLNHKVTLNLLYLQTLSDLERGK